MRCINKTTVNVVVDDRPVRTNVVATLRTDLRHLHLSRGVCKALAKQYGESMRRLQAMFAAPARSLSWSGHSLTGGPGTATS